jgi:isoquinoline 1-oxidoreductase beta subunit
MKHMDDLASGATPAPTDDEGGLSRRHFITASAVAGGMLIAASSPAVAKAGRFAGALPSSIAVGAGPAPKPSSTSALVNSWVLIGTDESITVYTGSVEMGQGVLSALAQVVAEELKVDWSAVKAVHSPVDALYNNPAYFSQVTGGSMSVRGYFSALQTAGAAAREMLIQAAATQWGVSTSGLVAAHGAVTNPATSLVLTYGALAPAAALLTPPASPPLTAPANYQIIGTTVPRTDIPNKVNGQTDYGIDISIPGMVYAAVRLAPNLGATVATVGATPAGCTGVVNLGDAVAVYASTYSNAFRGAGAIPVTWTVPASAAKVNDTAIMNKAVALMAKPGAGLIVAETIGNVTAGLAGATTTINSTYSVPYLSHATLEPQNCTVDLQPTSCTVWAPTQVQTSAVATIAAVSGLPASAVTLVPTFIGSANGRRLEVDFIALAVRIAKAINLPVKMIWSRQQDLTHDFYRPFALVNVQAGLNAAKQLVAWKYRIVSTSILRQKGYVSPGTPDDQTLEGSVALSYATPNRRVEMVDHPSLVPTGFLRSVGHSINCFVVESAIDELALAAGLTPLQFRLNHLGGAPRATAVLNAVSNLVNTQWGSTPSGRGRGVAYSESFGSISAQIAEVSEPSPGVIKVHRVACVVDCGTAVSPDNVMNQIEGGILHGMNGSLVGKMSFSKGAALSNNFDKYRMLRIKDMPDVTVQIINSGAAIGGIGEVGVPAIAPAIGNAYANLTGTRLRNLPFM